MGYYCSPLSFPLSLLVKTDHVVRSPAGTICHYIITQVNIEQVLEAGKRKRAVLLFLGN